MCMRLTGVGSQYVWAFTDAEKNFLNGTKTYRVTLLGDIGCYGGLAPTPHIDSFAAQGTRFKNEPKGCWFESNRGSSELMLSHSGA